MRRTILALVLWATPGAALAQPAPDVAAFQTRAATIAADPAVAGQWIVLLPVMAQQCGLVVDHERTALLVNRFAHPEVVDEAADYFASGAPNGLQAAWDAITMRDRAEACRLADSLWGEGGTLAPGILRHRPPAPGRMISQHGSGDETP